MAKKKSEPMGDPKIDEALEVLASGKTHQAIVEDLYWSALTRAPSANEVARAVEVLKKAPDGRAALEDLTWALLNAKEFLLRK